jgi:Protein of unknown function (DUF3788)
MDRPFLDSSRQPDEESMAVALGDAYPACAAILAQAAGFVSEWSFSKASGWMLKVTDRKKALFYLIPLNDGFKISLTIRETERRAFLADPAFDDDRLAPLRDAISGARKYPEGFALQFEIGDGPSSKPIALFLAKLIAARSGKAAPAAADN